MQVQKSDLLSEVSGGIGLSGSHARDDIASSCARAGDCNPKNSSTDSLNATDEYFMREAIAMAKQAGRQGEVPIGAVVVYDPINPATRKHINVKLEIIARAFNTRETDKNPAGHAEFQALLRASEALDAWRLSGCIVYVTLEPCIMCAGLMHQARIDRCVFGASDPKAGALGSLYKINEDTRLNHTFAVTGGVLREECGALLSDFFRARRNHKKK